MSCPPGHVRRARCGPSQRVLANLATPGPSARSPAARACSIACWSWPTEGAPDVWPFSSRYSRHDMPGDCSGSPNGSTPSISNVGEPRMPHLAASPSLEMTWCDTETPARPCRTAASRSLRTGALGQPGTARTVGCMHPAPVFRLPGQVPVEPLQRRPDHRALMPASRHDVPADRLAGTAQRLAHHRGLVVPGPAAPGPAGINRSWRSGRVAHHASPGAVFSRTGPPSVTGPAVEPKVVG